MLNDAPAMDRSETTAAAREGALPGSGLDDTETGDRGGA